MAEPSTVGQDGIQSGCITGRDEKDVESAISSSEIDRDADDGDAEAGDLVKKSTPSDGTNKAFTGLVPDNSDSQEEPEEDTLGAPAVEIQSKDSSVEVVGCPSSSRENVRGPTTNFVGQSTTVKSESLTSFDDDSIIEVDEKGEAAEPSVDISIQLTPKKANMQRARSLPRAQSIRLREMEQQQRAGRSRGRGQDPALPVNLDQRINLQRARSILRAESIRQMTCNEKGPKASFSHMQSMQRAHSVHFDKLKSDGMSNVDIGEKIKETSPAKLGVPNSEKKKKETKKTKNQAEADIECKRMAKSPLEGDTRGSPPQKMVSARTIDEKKLAVNHMSREEAHRMIREAQAVRAERKMQEYTSSPTPSVPSSDSRPSPTRTASTASGPRAPSRRTSTSTPIMKEGVSTPMDGPMPGAYSMPGIDSNDGSDSEYSFTGGDPGHLESESGGADADTSRGVESEMGDLHSVLDDRTVTTFGERSVSQSQQEEVLYEEVDGRTVTYAAAAEAQSSFVTYESAESGNRTTASPLQQEAALPVYYDHEQVSYGDNTTKRPRWCFFPIMCCVLAVVGLVVGLPVFLFGIKNGSPPPPEPLPDVFTQCKTNKEIVAVREPLRSRYLEVKQSILPSLYPNSITVNELSCTPHNLALLSLASEEPPSTTMLSSNKTRFLLNLIYWSLGGEDWTTKESWSSPTPECEWEGVSCDSSGQLESLVLRGNQLVGPIPTEIGLLSTLKSMDWSNNDLDGTFPTEFGQLSQLELLDLRSCKLQQGIPTFAGGMTSLRILKLAKNSLDGLLPSELGRLTELAELDFQLNGIEGLIPTELGLLESLVALQFDNNFLTGSIPREIGNLRNLAVLTLEGNLLDTSVPSELFSLTSLEILNVINCGIRGSFPPFVENFKSMRELLVGSNSLKGSIPTDIGHLTDLRELNADSNQLTGIIPAEIGNCTSLEKLSLVSNSMSSTIPSELASISTLVELQLARNDLSGTISQAFCDLDANPKTTAFSIDCSISCSCCISNCWA